MLKPEPNMIGAYGPWAASLVGDEPARLSFRRAEFTDVEAWRAQARPRAEALFLAPVVHPTPTATLTHQYDFDGLQVEHLTWQLPYGPPTEAVLLKPAGATDKLPGVLALHDHGGNKYFGWRKIARVSRDVHPVMRRHQDDHYGGVGWANELARRGCVVLAHDVFSFGSRRVRAADIATSVDPAPPPEKNPEAPDEIAAYNRFAGQHEHLIAKSLFCAGLTWPGVPLAEDRAALGLLAARDDVDAARLACAGLSGGGLRTVYLAGLDERIKTACCAGMMTTWRDYLLYKCWTHTWMIYVPGLPRELDYPEVLGLRAPQPVLVQSCEQDPLFSRGEMQRADTMLTEIYRKAEAADAYRGTFYPGGHRFDRAMQAEAFAWFERWL